METKNAALIVDLLLNILLQAEKYRATLAQARAEGRDVTDSEVAAAKADADAARAELQASIDRRVAGG